MTFEWMCKRSKTYRSKFIKEKTQTLICVFKKSKKLNPEFEHSKDSDFFLFTCKQFYILVIFSKTMMFF